MNTSFSYPVQREMFKQVKNKNELKKLLEKSKDDLQILKQFYKIKVSGNKTYMQAKCNKCQAKIRYKYNQSQSIYELKWIQNQHKHQQKQYYIVDKYIESLPINFTTSNVNLLLRTMFNISKSKAYYHQRKYRFEKGGISRTFNNMDKLNYDTRHLPFPLEQGNLPDFFITTSPKMKQNFRRFGQFLSYDVTYNLIKQRKTINNRIVSWGVGIFLGRNNYNKPIPFAISILNSQSKDSFLTLFQNFFQIVGKPQVIITDQQQSIISALQHFKQHDQWNGVHLHDTFHIIRLLARKTSNKKLISFLTEAMFTSSQNDFEYLVNKAKQSIQNEIDSKLYTNFVENSQKCCISKTPEYFHGVSISTSSLQKLNDMIKTVIQYERPYCYVIQRLIKLMETIQQKSIVYKLCKIPYEQIFNDYSLKVLRFKLNEVIFSHLIKNYAREYDNQNFQFIELHHKYTVTLQKGYFKCNCSYTIKTGLPCIHILKICIDTRSNFQYYVSKRWIIQPNESLPIKKVINIKKGRTRLSRRNISK